MFLFSELNSLLSQFSISRMTIFLSVIMTKIAPKQIKDIVVVVIECLARKKLEGRHLRFSKVQNSRFKVHE